MPDIAKIIRERRISLNLSIPKAAEKADLSDSFLSKFERNVNTNISLDKLLRLCDALDLKITDLFDDNEEFNPEEIYTPELVKYLKSLPLKNREKISKNFLEILQTTNKDSNN
ncbi:helix-turn-helix transcriptional regulator [Lactobacillus sp. YT155]|uniref:helix-turn-helix domain-containing protein n=1 Tax=Lactobacillus sp. YT155 TaxID=3060955 RepID=UPI00265FED7E|nr:helix-turn-helix transcriptional regulator [Lactobacillus sp. YT155]MDO1605909.1 helix-turn-helix transcriptional regulator [Lactobacillus sp. YT155]